MQMQEESRVENFTIPRFEKIPFLVHGFGTRYWKEKDFKKHSKLKNFRLLSLAQIHSNIVQYIEKYHDKEVKGDAMLTDRSLILLFIKTADCLPVLIVDESRKVIAAVHCGWKGTSKRVLQKAVQGMQISYGCNPISLLVAFGPSIGRDCYEVGKDVYKNFEEAGLSTEVFRDHPLREEKYLLDLKQANRSQLLRSGIREQNIFSIDLCTHCEKYLLSFRRDKNNTGRMLNYIGISF